MTIDSLPAELAAIKGVEVRKSRFKGTPAFWVGGTEIAHFDDDAVIDIRLTAPLIRAMRSDLRANPAVTTISHP